MLLLLGNKGEQDALRKTDPDNVNKRQEYLNETREKAKQFTAPTEAAGASKAAGYSKRGEPDIQETNVTEQPPVLKRRRLGS